ncbi:MAG: fimbrillin family protein [Prevotella sp.]|jgi:hypothetical protein|nr:fimbrillin family protein [Prevotella sp.]
MITKRRNFVFRFLPGLFLSGLLLLSGCSQDDVSNVPAGSRAIGFRAQGGMSALKATTTGADYIRSFAVNAHYGTYDAAGKFLIEGVTVYRGEGGGTDWTYSPQAYFPTEDKGGVNFFAYSPSGSKCVEGSLKEAAVANDANQTITYEVPEPTGAATSQEDLLVARQTVMYNSGNSAYPGAAVSLQFHHALSRILVAASSSLGQEVPVVITGLELKNLYTKGTLPLNSDDLLATAWGHITGEAGAKVLWANDGSTTANYAYSLPASGVHVGETLATVTGDDQGIFVLPQTTKGDPSDGNPAAGVTGGEFGLKVSYSINGSPDIDAYIQFGDIAEPVVATEGVTFEIGRQYVLNLTFGAGSGGGDTPGGTDPDINIGAKISFGTLGVDGYPEDDIEAFPYQPPVMYAHDPVIWSQSNIYYDESADVAANVGALTFSESAQDKKYYQGIYFKWGSLVGVSSGSVGTPLKDSYLFIPDSDGKYYKAAVSQLKDWTDDDGVVDSFKDAYFGSIDWDNVYSSDNATYTAAAAILWAAIPCVADNSVISPVPADIATGREARDDNALTTASGTVGLPYSSYKGDICKYLVDKKSTNGNSSFGYTWRMPTSNDFGYGYGNSGPITNNNDDSSADNESDPAPAPYRTFWNSSGTDNGGSFTASTNPEDGTDILNGKAYYTLVDWVFGATAKPSFPASGCRNDVNGYSGLFGGNGYYWSSSASGALSARNLNFNSGIVLLFNSDNRPYGYSVRCVRDGENVAP